MSRYVDAEWLKQNFNSVFWSQITKTIDSAPSIGIVRCSECKYASDDGTYGCMCEHFNDTSDAYHRMWSDDFCSRGERNRSEKPNNCETCKWWEGNTNFCYSKADSDDHACHYEPKDKWREERSSE